ncbi:uncharacterized protein UBRO_20673 [Ustilago bromivora]|uniref:Uncharacterized protein n=1 Tax=Ustilago bromivora TaxID=307758 RepID=A0A1K0GR11_9BASI|nr:uncharacterized protein UBRO_20673 [Ustilago bromivora]
MPCQFKNCAMPLQLNDPHIANNPLPEDSSDDQAETVPVPPGHQTITRHKTPSPCDSGSDNNKLDEPLLDLNNINRLNATTLQNMLIELALHKQAETSVSQGLRRRSCREDLKWAPGGNDLIGQVVHINCEINRGMGFWLISPKLIRTSCQGSCA